VSGEQTTLRKSLLAQRVLDLVREVGRGRDFILVAKQMPDAIGKRLALKPLWRPIGLEFRHDAERPAPVARHVAVTDEGGISRGLYGVDHGLALEKIWHEPKIHRQVTFIRLAFAQPQRGSKRAFPAGAPQYPFNT
jgi:hypothetical protein